ncbi:hydroxyacid dehydrogenase [Tersicoccus phoenicis]|uniref:Hydroxyacid dehydrogenase n=1 Tax=Tersicoccus phoenicis TaxID=554083 RepID=A0A1R1LJH0_9MICC|nr:D-2-hydroxyacid dehydrogenase [Tersicoccus phoenicis]OMH27681.1 hydroxyacid dehydrogenase [Tersicoccus phoenicis]
MSEFAPFPTTPDGSAARRPTVVVLTAPGTAPPTNTAALERHAELVFTDAAGLPAALPGASVLFVWDFFSTALRDAWVHADALEWVHVAAAGVDSLLFDGLRDSGVTVTNAQGAFDGPIAEFVLASVLAHDKQLHQSRRLQDRAVWRHREVQRSAGRRALVVGTGGIGRATARLLRAVGIEVRGAGRTGRDDDPDLGLVVPSAELADHVGWADHVVLIAPLTAATRGLVDARVLARMKPTAHLVNVGRGALLDEPALVTALRTGTIAAASLDVFTEEPLPADHPFWRLENVQVSAHMSGDVVGWRDTLAQQFEDNLLRWCAGTGLRNVVDKQVGYVRSS